MSSSRTDPTGPGASRGDAFVGNGGDLVNGGTPPVRSLSEAAVLVLETADPHAKSRLGRCFAAAWRSGALDSVGSQPPPPRPARPARPELVAPGAVPRRRIGSAVAGRVALLHALAHIELNAVDLTWDIIARFADAWLPGPLPRAFFSDWVGVADDEARHFALVAARLEALGSGYGALPAHDGLWQAAEGTAGDLAARLAVVPLVLEARGLDVTPEMIRRLTAVGDVDSAAILQIIHDDEIGHVRVGRRWFERVMAAQGKMPVPAYHALVRRHFRGRVKPPFNEPARDAAGFHAAFYAPLALDP